MAGVGTGLGQGAGHYPPPPLSPWSTALRYLVALAPAVTAVPVWYSTERPLPSWQSSGWALALNLVLGLVGLYLVHVRRRWPVLAASAAALFTAVSFASAGAALVCFLSVCTRRRPRELAITWAAIVVSLAISVAVDDEPLLWGSVVVQTLMVAAVMLAGLYVGARRDLLASLHDRAETAEREQELRAQQARISERTRIAREMHDVMAHRVSLLSMHAGALAYRTDLTPQQTRAAADVIASNATAALDELRVILGTLRQDELVDAAPQPSLAALPDLIDQARAAGQRVQLKAEDDLTSELSPEVTTEVTKVPTRVSRDAYRIVQEGLTNARKHAPHTTVQVAVRVQGPELEVLVSNPLRVGASPGPGSRLGLVGLAERVGLAGGTLTHGVVDGDFTLLARLPLTDQEPAR